MPTLLDPRTIADLGALENRAARVEAITFLRDNQQSGATDSLAPQSLVIRLNPGKAPRIATDGALAAPVDGRIMTVLGDGPFLGLTGDHFLLDGRACTVGRVQRLPDYRTVAEFTFDSGVP
ncbi:MAG TPA: hypothetical protein VH475_23165 [Tepidisphaeraceae bacterium]|jgi:hypothetical protein